MQDIRESALGLFSLKRYRSVDGSFACYRRCFVISRCDGRVIAKGVLRKQIFIAGHVITAAGVDEPLVTNRLAARWYQLVSLLLVSTSSCTDYHTVSYELAQRLVQVSTVLIRTLTWIEIVAVRIEERPLDRGTSVVQGGMTVARMQ